LKTCLKTVELFLLEPQRQSRRPGCLFLKGSIHSFVATVPLRTPRLNAFVNDPIFIQPSESFDKPSKPVPANDAPLSVLILEGIPYSRIAASQTALTWLKSIWETI
jgi:hypothetical protein